jgi:DNA-binding PadR family transcriptional regulator
MKVKKEDILKKMPKEGFLKISREENQNLTQEKRIALMRKGNEFFNQGKIDIAKRIFITTGYSDGLIRLGDHYMERKQPLEALRMYYLAPQKKKVNELIEKIALVIKNIIRV